MFAAVLAGISGKSGQLPASRVLKNAAFSDQKSILD
jgi:hypothetical protein